MTSSLPPSILGRDLFKEGEMSEETKSLLSTLPRKRGWVTKHIYLYQGFWFTARRIQGLVACRKHFKAQHSDTILVTHPKCGTTWLKAMAFALTTRSPTTPVVPDDHPLLTTNPHTLVPSFEDVLYSDTSRLPDLSSLASPRLFGTHAPLGLLPTSVMDDPSCKIVYLCRNPKDTVVSMWHFFNKLRPREEGTLPLDEMVDEFCNGECPFGPFWDHVLGYLESSPRKVLFLKYEDIKERPADELRRLARFLERPFSPEEEKGGVVDDILRLCSFDHLSSLEVNKTGNLSFGEPNKVFFRKGIVGDSANILTLEMSEKIDCVTKVKLHNSRLKF